MSANSENWCPIEHVFLGGVWVAVATRAELAAAAVHDAKLLRGERRPRLVFDANGHGISLAATERKFRSTLAHADVIHADGGFLVTASRIFAALPIPERSATTDMIHDFAVACSKQGLSFYLLGATEDVNARATEILRNKYPSLRIVGRRNGYFSREEEDSVVSEINRLSPDILWVGLGKPLEQEFCIRQRNSLNCAWVITCGGCYNYITGDYSRAPLWMQKSNLEWVHRAVTKPKELLWRYVRTTPHALALTTLKSSRKLRQWGARQETGGA